jgi:glutathione S-transferase
VTLGELIGCDFAPYPNIQRWLGNMKKLPTWSQVNQEFYGLRDMIKGQSFVHV